MKDIKAYIESGILELYVIGDLSAEQIREVEDLAAQHPEIRQELDAIERSMEQYASQHAVSPSPDLKDKLLSFLQEENQDHETEGNRKTVPLYPAHSHSNSKIRNLQIALAACAALLIISIIALYSAHDQLGEAKNQISTLSLQNQKYTSAVNFMKQTNADLQKIADMTTDPDWKFVKLAGTTMDPKASMMLYWHTTGKHVMMDNSKMNLPATDKEHQYQLWAIVNGKPVDLGVFDQTSGSDTLLIKMKEVASAQAFAVTLEKRGGNPTPTMEQMIVMGGVSI